MCCYTLAFTQGGSSCDDRDCGSKELAGSDGDIDMEDDIVDTTPKKSMVAAAVITASTCALPFSCLRAL